MDRKSTIGLIIIGIILTVWVIWTSYKSPEQKAAIKRFNDSVELARLNKVKADSVAAILLKAKNDSIAKTIAPKDTSAIAIKVSDSLKADLEIKKWRDFYPATKGENKCVVLENEKIKVNICTKGGRISSVVLKEYTRSDRKTNVELFEEKYSRQNTVLNVYENTSMSLDSLYFTTDAQNTLVSENETKSVKMRMPLAKAGAYVEFIYTLKANDYMVDYKMNFVKMDEILTEKAPVAVEWGMKYPSQELHISKERNTSGIYYMNTNKDVEDFGLTGKDEKKVLTDGDGEIKWVAFKQQFFTSAIISKSSFMQGTNLGMTNYGIEDAPNKEFDDKYVKEVNAKLLMDDAAGKKTFDFSFYFGPNHYKTMKGYEQGLEDMIPMGWSFFSYINKWLVVPVFGLFKDSSMSFGWVILILTFIIKLLLSPIGYMTYKSSAKMKVLKPETDAIAEKYGKDGDQMKKTQETQALYRRAGVSMFSGCLPLVFQMFVLIALFNFFPAAIELRQQSFWWSDDLSTYDSVWNFGFRVPGYGDHMSMFALMMFVSTIGFTWYQQKMFPNQQTSMPGMKFMMYLMPVIFLSFMNDYSAGLSWYYFVANVINILQNLVLRKFVDDKKLRAEIDAHMKKPQAKKSGFAARLEEAAKQRQRQIKK